jgi:flagellar hook-length control protein FliK
VICESGYITSPPTFDDRSEYSAADTLPEKFEQQTLRRQEEQADMSRRLAEALGQRLTAQISRGAWRVEMDLHPKSLGRIEIQLEMKNGELEANFTAANAATRELIQESMPRLRAAFEEHGMESAYIGLGLENQSQSDGKPTGQNSPNEVEATSDSEEAQLNAQTSRLDQYGLDLLV